MVLIGHSYLSFLFGLELIRAGQKILILDDDRLDFGELYRDGIGPLEVSFLKTWGIDRDIGPLIHIEDYLTSVNQVYHFGDRSIRLGPGPMDNLAEMVRKIPEFWGESINEVRALLSSEVERREWEGEFFRLCETLGQNAFRFKILQNFNMDFFLNQTPEKFKKQFSIVFENLEGLGDDPFGLQCFFFLLTGHVQKKMTLKLSHYERIHLFLNALGPHFTLDIQRLEGDLIKVFQEKGGHFKRTQVREWKFYQKKPWCLELASYEGIIHPKKVSFIGGRPRGIPLKLGTCQGHYQTIHFSFSLPAHFQHGKEGHQVFYTQSKKMGTRFPMWYGMVQGEQLHVRYFYRYQEGSKKEFFVADILSILKKEVCEVFPDLEQLNQPLYIEEGREIYLDHSFRVKVGSVPNSISVPLFDYSKPLDGVRLKNVYYFGPFRDAPLGLLSGLMELKEGPNYLS
jgi:hypothetical protein